MHIESVALDNCSTFRLHFRTLARISVDWHLARWCECSNCMVITIVTHDYMIGVTFLKLVVELLHFTFIQTTSDHTLTGVKRTNKKHLSTYFECDGARAYIHKWFHSKVFPFLVSIVWGVKFMIVNPWNVVGKHLLTYYW